MLDIRRIRTEPDRVRQGLEAKRTTVDLDTILALDAAIRENLGVVEVKKAESNKGSKSIPERMKAGEDVSSLKAELAELSREIKELDQERKVAEADLAERLRWLPNLPHDSVPLGDESNNVVVRSWGDPVASADWRKPHYEIGESLGLVDFARGSKLSGAGFVVFTDWGARLERALIQYFLDHNRERFGFVEVATPYLVRRETMYGTGQIPKLEEDMYRTEPDDLFLIPTAEVSITNLFAEEQLAHGDLPIYRMGYSPCFRREAGTYGKETRGLVRVHQFDKVEVVKIVDPEVSYAELESLVGIAESLLQSLNLPYRILSLASGDLSFAAAKCYDLEVWAASEGRWLEVSSCSNFEDFQARRMNLRWRNGENKLVFPHTLNGSALALPRIVVAILENYQTEAGTVRVPEVLKPYLGGLEEFASPGSGK